MTFQISDHHGDTSTHTSLYDAVVAARDAVYAAWTDTAAEDDGDKDSAAWRQVLARVHAHHLRTQDGAARIDAAVIYELPGGQNVTITSASTG